MKRFSRKLLLALASALFLLAGVIELCVRQWAMGAMWLALAFLYVILSRRRCNGAGSVQDTDAASRKKLF